MGRECVAVFESLGHFARFLEVPDNGLENSGVRRNWDQVASVESPQKGSVGVRKGLHRPGCPLRNLSSWMQWFRPGSLIDLVALNPSGRLEPLGKLKRCWASLPEISILVV